jgi:AraC-like DNA-binding protein
MDDYRELMRQAWAATGQQRYRDIAAQAGMSHATVHRLLNGSTSHNRRRVLRLLRWIYGPDQTQVIGMTIAAHDAARQARLDVARRNYLTERGR